MNGICYNRRIKADFHHYLWNNLIKKYRFTLLLSFCVTIITIISFSVISTTVNAEKTITREKSVVSVKIEKGDTLWSIAKEHITDEYNSMESYINEIKKSNGLTSETIHAGSYIIVPYYKPEK